MQAGVGSKPVLGAYDIGEKIIIILVFGLFIATIILFQSHITREPTAIPIDTMSRHPLRSVFRVIKRLQSNRGYLNSRETFLCLFYTVPMATIMLVFLVRRSGTEGFY
ncbi:LOW QUALITY PROTEIN: Rta1 domain-containing protein [Colletotrichum higginsianum IMI 349063]|uniref:Rta1 domain-containing protein n=1 Tax=Colletotrichum higginsianum (strain IMI 349063) TaxID=759273 RepID=A0A1B7XSK9_COLHI|nr:LOW QUALITY PROTEIN: Rta1 domain-containing protein [Colletotrichum higginsianum IMI 349063]OBR02714.1 LOW QUALITY PROTEIN: Rta1 domain-containing protein [Colletotrichum higginsianum IMI 349063]